MPIAAKGRLVRPAAIPLGFRRAVGFPARALLPGVRLRHGLRALAAGRRAMLLEVKIMCWCAR
jgi:hypothetical protein